jgi:DegV family protein with EDD domain
MNYYIIADETCDLPVRYRKTEDFKIIPMACIIDGISYMDGTDKESSQEEFFKYLDAGKLPTTTQINPFTFFEIWKPILLEGKDVIYIALSSAISGTYESAVSAAKEMKAEFPDRKIYVIDSKCASGGIGLLVYYALKAREDGLNIDALFEYVETLKDNICHYFTVDSLKHLFRTGRVSKAYAVIGTVLSIKPLLHVDINGALIPLDKCMGRKASLNWLVNKMAEQIDPELNKVVFLNDSNCPADQDFVAARINEKFPDIEVVKGIIGKIISSHTGSGTMALFFIGKNGKGEKK